MIFAFLASLSIPGVSSKKSWAMNVLDNFPLSWNNSYPRSMYSCIRSNPTRLSAGAPSRTKARKSCPRPHPRSTNKCPAWINFNIARYKGERARSKWRKRDFWKHGYLKTSQPFLAFVSVRQSSTAGDKVADSNTNYMLDVVLHLFWSNVGVLPEDLQPLLPRYQTSRPVRPMEETIHVF